MSRTTLVISRRENEMLLIGDVRVTVTRAGRTVRLSIEAPRETKILRGELERRDELGQPNASR